VKSAKSAVQFLWLRLAALGLGAFALKILARIFF